jgi:uncharacterized protein YndB with AHSA1/START domain
MNTDRIEKKILLHAPIERVWRALADSTEFGSWFGMKFDGPFVPGRALTGVITTTTVDPEVAKAQKPHEGLKFEIFVETLDPERLFSFRWHPHAVKRDVDYSGEPMTVVAFELKQEKEGVLLTVTESGFDQIPLERRAQAFAANDGGWGMVIKLIEVYLAEDRLARTP